MKKWISLLLVAFVNAVFCSGLQNPSDYAKNSSLQWNRALSAIERYPWRDSEKVLDVGCGEGKISAWIAQRYTDAEVVGLDISSPMIHFALSHFPKNTYPNLTFCEGDLCQLPYDNAFDLIVSFNSFHYVMDPAKALRSIQTSLRSKGRFLCVVPGRNPANLGPLSEKLVQTEKWAPYFPSFQKQRTYLSKEESIEQIENAGMAVLYFLINCNLASFSSQRALIDWLRPFVNFISHLPQDRQDEFLFDLSSMQIAATTLNPDESFVLDDIIHEFLCEKF